MAKLDIYARKQIINPYSIFLVVTIGKQKKRQTQFKTVIKTVHKQNITPQGIML